MNANLPLYTQPEYKQKLIAMGGSGTVYSLVMPESERMLCRVVDGYDRSATWKDGYDASEAREQEWLDMYREPWTQKQDVMHEAYFDKWIEWTRAVLNFRPEQFPNRYPTAGASEGIVKLMAEHYSAATGEKRIHIFDGEYEGFAAFAASLNIEVVRHNRAEWKSVVNKIGKGEQFWISQPSAIDGEVWEDWNDFMFNMLTYAPEAQVIPDLTYVGAVAADYNINLYYANIPAFVMSHSKPLGGYYQRVGGVFAREEWESLFGNKWFKNLQSLRWGTMMMEEYGVQELPQRYRKAQEAATAHLSAQLGVDLKPCAVMLLASGEATEGNVDPLVASLTRAGRIRICVTPQMDKLIR